MTPRAALLIIDMQDEFLTAAGMFKKPVRGAPLMDALTMLVEAARAGGYPVVWITSLYPDREVSPPPLRPSRPAGPRYQGVPMNSDHLAGGHAGRPCCAPGSKTAEMYGPAAQLMAPNDLQVVKHRYSAFSETDLASQLRALGVTEVVITGVVSNVCVRATAADAFFHEFEVWVPEDAVGATSTARMQEGLTAIATWYGEVTSSAGVLDRWKSRRLGLGAGDSAVYYGLLPEDIRETALAAVQEEVEWHDMRHRGGLVPRKIAIQGTIDPSGTWPVYRHPADEQPPLVRWTPMVDRLRKIVEAQLGQPINHALIQRYVDGASNIKLHADKTLDVLRQSAISNFSLGATRTMLLSPKRQEHPPAQNTRVALPHGSLFVLGWDTNRGFKHGIRPDRRPDGEKHVDERRDGGERVSITFRTIATFCGPDGQLFGQGARTGPPLADALQQEGLLEAFGQENRDPEFDWDAHYGQGFDRVNFRTRGA